MRLPVFLLSEVEALLRRRFLLQHIGVFACLPEYFPAPPARIDRRGSALVQISRPRRSIDSIPAVMATGCFLQAERFSHEHA